MDKLTLMTLAAAQPFRAVKYGPTGAVEHARCALRYIEGNTSSLIRRQHLDLLYLAKPEDPFIDRCYECNDRRMEFE